MAKQERRSLSEETEIPLPHLGGTVAALCLRHSGAISSDVSEDCYLEALLMLWKIRHKLASLPQSQREPYSRVCVRNAVTRLLQREHQTKAREVPLEELADANSSLAARHAVYVEIEAALSESLADWVSSPSLHSALCALDAAEYQVLDLVYGQGLNDAEAALQLNTTAAALRKRRERTLAKVRRRLSGTA